MEQGLLITRRENRILVVRVESGKIVQMQAEPIAGALLGNVYVGKVRNIVKNINAAFVEFQKGQMGYLSLNTKETPIHTGNSNRQDERVLIGDEIIVQVEREAVKSKPPTLSGAIELPGCYVVLTTKKNIRNSVSKKIKDVKKREWLQSFIMKYSTEEYGFVARTNSEDCTEESLKAELMALSAQYAKIVQRGEHRVIFSELYTAPHAYLSQIRDSSQKKLQEIITDDDDLFEEISDYIHANRLADKMALSGWNPSDGKMDAVYDISRTIERAMRPKVWLKNGAYLVIQPTEALVAIDVNSGKAISKKKDVEKTYFNVNIEAAKEIARQLRLRNLSGMIVVDFIDMKNVANKEELMKILRQEVAKDSVQTTVVDMTALGLVELTRKKLRKPLYEQLQDKDA
ncbi:MAG: ribonuclease E/G [Lachnospiraceae bacterium]|nr:ribonuclease E/G [Lachnospiraceae bacterium]